MHAVWQQGMSSKCPHVYTWVGSLLPWHNRLQRVCWVRQLLTSRQVVPVAPAAQVAVGRAAIFNKPVLQGRLNNDLL